MKPTKRLFVLPTLLLNLACLFGCQEEKVQPTPQQVEELRQREIERAKAFQKEG
jgi:hypothetical protein